MAKWLCSETCSSALLVSSPLKGSGVLAKNIVELDLPAGLKGLGGKLATYSEGEINLSASRPHGKKP
jgi:hypothetical protein